MIDARNYKTSEELAEAMEKELEKEYREQLYHAFVSLIKDIRIQLECLTTLLSMTDIEKCVQTLDKYKLYAFADQVESSVKRLDSDAISVKNICRLVHMNREYDE